MTNNSTVNFRNPTLVRKAGMSALQKELGSVGTTYFMRQFTIGQGDYTSEREKLLSEITFEDIVKNAQRFDEQYL